MPKRRYTRKEFLQISAVPPAGALALHQLGGPGPSGSAGDKDGPDVIYHGGKIITANDAFDVEEAVAIKGGRFVAVGSDKEVRKLATKSTPMVDLGGRAVVAGFFDNHIHLTTTLAQEWRGALITGVPEWIQGVDTMEKLAESLGQRAQEIPAGEWIVGALTREEWPNQLIPTRWELDEMAPDHPVALTRGPHTVIINSAGFEITGITRDTPDPPGGWIVRDEDGEPSGRILEAAKRLVDPHLPPPEDSGLTTVEAWRQFLTQLVGLGITSVNVAGMRPHQTAQVQELYVRHGEDLPRMTMQVRLSPGFDTYDDPEEGAAEEIRLMEQLPYTGFGDDRLKIGAIKMSIDGGLSAPVMWTLDHYHDRPDFHGVQRIPDETFYEVSKAAHDRGWQIGVHTIGDAAAVMVVEQLARILGESPRSDHRHYLHHVTVKPPEDTLQKMAELELTVVTHPSWTTNLGAFTEEVIGQGSKLETQNPSRSLLDHGIHISYGSDGVPYSPIFNIWNAVTRRGWDGEVYGPQEAVTVEEAIQLHTKEAAFATFDEEDLGTIEVGKLADMAILGADPLTVDPETIWEIPVEATIIDGKVVYPGSDG